MGTDESLLRGRRLLAGAVVVIGVLSVVGYLVLPRLRDLGDLILVAAVVGSVTVVGGAIFFAGVVRSQRRSRGW